ncbi:MAG: EpsG family protein [Flavobacteriales bacterium]|nr:EpsG family protein [Flavobacteriales bacterium]
MKTQISYKNELSDFLLISVVSPAFGLWKLFQARSERFVVTGSVLMMGLFGALFAYPEDSDGYTHYIRSLKYYTWMDLDKFLNESWNILTQHPTLESTDLYIHVLYFLSNSVLGIPRSLHFFAGLALGYFISKSLLLVLGKDLKKIKLNSGLLVFMVLLLVHTVYSLNAIRTNTAMWVMFYGVSGFYLKRQWKFLLFIILATQIHMAYLVIAIPAILGFFLANRKWITILIWLISFYQQVSFEGISSYLPETEAVENKTKVYVLDKQRMDEFQDHKQSLSGNWYSSWGPNLYYGWGLTIAVIGVILVYIKSKTGFLNYLIGTSLLYYSSANMVLFSPSLQGRLINHVSMFVVFAMLYYSSSIAYKLKGGFRNFTFKFSSLLFFLISIPFLLKNVSHIINTTDVFFLSGPFLALFTDEKISIRNLIGNLL